MSKRHLLGKAVGIVLLTCMVLATRGAFAKDWQLSTNHSFGNPVLSANAPSSGLILASDKKLYGTSEGGIGRNGTVFRLNADGSHFEVIHFFTDPTNGGAGPLADVVEASDGMVYGTTLAGGTNLAGTIFRMHLDGSGFETIYHFVHGDTAAAPFGELIEGRDGKLYGTTRQGGAFNSGSVFRINKDGSNFEAIHDFSGDGAADGGFPECPLLLGMDGALYGTCNDNDERDVGNGKVFKLQTDGSGFQILHDFDVNPADGGYLGWGLMEGRDGLLYGTTSRGGSHDKGIVFRLKKDGTGYKILHAFGNLSQRHGPSTPFGPLRQTSEGLIYGVTPDVIFVLTPAGSVQVADTFGKGLRDGVTPVGALAVAGRDDLYGVTMSGGMAGGGTVFHFSGGKHRVLHDFNSTGGDGAQPNSPLVSIDNNITNSWYFGTTAAGGLYGHGTVYQMNSDGSGYKLLRSFSDRPIGLVTDKAGSNVYVTTLGPGVKGSGALYRMKLNGNLKLLHRFHGGSKDGAVPGAPLSGMTGGVQIDDGMLYGLTQAGGAAGYGVIYRIGIDGKGYRILHHFDSSNGVPNPTLTLGSDFALYGTTSGIGQGLGSAFRINRDGSGFTVLHVFRPGDAGGAHPSGPILQGMNGFLYGATENSASPIIYAMNNDGTDFEIVYTFSNYSGPVSNLLDVGDGKLYGVAPEFGDAGTVFRVDDIGTGFETLQSFGWSYGTPAVSRAFFVGLGFSVTAPDGGDMNLGRAMTLR